MKEAKMSFKKILAVAAVTGLVTAMALPALALENEFHGMFKFFGYESNFFNGLGANLNKDAHSGFFAEQRARVQYTAKANDNLKLVTHFELDSRFGGKPTSTGAITDANVGYLGTATGNDAGNLDADQLTLETKNVYLDFNCPITGANVKAGIQPWGDAYKGVFLSADMTGVYASKKFEPLTASLGWFRFDDNTAKASTTPGDLTADLIVVDAKFAVGSDVTVGASYYNIQNDSGTAVPPSELLHMVGLNASIKAGPATIDPFIAYQFGDVTATRDLSAYMGGVTAKVNVGAGNINLAGLYLSGEQTPGAGDSSAFRSVSAGTSYFNPANMWLLVRSSQGINTSTSVLGNDLTVGGHGLVGAFAGFDGTADKLFFNANAGYVRTANKQNSNEDKSLGTEINAQVGYKLFDNLSISIAGAYAFLGDALNSTNAAERVGGAADADNPYMSNVQLSYTF
jgi:hypothetical protein